MAQPGEDVVLETSAGTHLVDKSQIILSFVFTIDDKHYVGWDIDAGAGDLKGIVTYGLGYVDVIPQKFDPDSPEVFLVSTLTQKLVGYRVNRTDVIAVYGVRITDEGVSFILYKQSADYQWPDVFEAQK